MQTTCEKRSRQERKTAARAEIVRRLAAAYARKGWATPEAAEVVAKGHFADWRNKLSGWFAAARELMSAGVKVDGIEHLRTEFVRWEVGGTYRHRTLIRCDASALPAEGDRVASRGAAVDALFGRGSSSRRGWVVRPEGVEVYSDQ